MITIPSRTSSPKKPKTVLASRRIAITILEEILKKVERDQ